MKHFLWPPNWEANVVERLEWLTDVQQSSNGTEVRKSLRSAPRSSLTFEVFAQGADAVRLRNFIQANQGQKVMIPWWVSGIKYDSTAFAMTNIPTKLGINSTYSIGYGPVGSQVLIAKNGQSWVRATSASNGSNLGISSANWPLLGPDRPGAMLYPMIQCHMNAATSMTAPTGDIMHGSITFEALEIVPHESTTLPTQHNGLPVLLEQPNRIQDHTLEYNRLVSELDFMTGKRAFSIRSNQSFRTVSHEYFFHKYAEIVPFKSFLNSLRGRDNELYLPSFSCDFQNLSISGGLFSSRLDFDDVGYRNAPGVARAFWVHSSKGEHFKDVITITSQPGGRERITGSSMPILADELLLNAQLLYKSRLATDAVEITWHNSELATVNLPFRTIRVQ